ncbi:TOMM precursor leader peptide-binding protein [Virgisporangium aurantiacum]|uniref:YcaO domain-containing protein n=1 Tax=Virgisporangium aurantiacum TaxID=175570 RepID=A0A8J3ZGP2_9ACTN|nr:TOMM precursor leader peptide-binding protein [Virgisporangium aurantiacum]GIJ63829.1 hypothetical protein Vau01_113450 [Virgisporangium aurantiacum]
MRADPPPAVVGRGRLAAAIAGRLAVSVLDGPDLIDADATAVVHAVDSWDAAAREPVREACSARGASWIPVWTELGRVFIGPMERHGTTGCVRCMELRRQRAHEYGRERAAALEAYDDRRSLWITDLACDTVAALVADDLAWLGTRTSGALLEVALDTLAVSSHRILPDPLCEVCGSLLDDSAALAELVLSSRPMAEPGSLRAAEARDRVAGLLDSYVDPETGLVRTVGRGVQGSLVVAVAPLHMRIDDRVERGFGRTRSYRTSEAIAVFEALERYGARPGARRTVVEGSFATLRRQALDPRRLGLHAPESYERPGFYYRTFDENAVCRWSWGYSLSRAEPVLVPEPTAFYGVPYDTASRPFAYELSNGCALGSCLEEAIIHGLLEVLERDSFLMTWYGRLPVPRIDFRGATDRAVPMQAAAIRAETGYEVRVFDTTMEHGIPSIWAMAVNPDPADGRPATLSTAGANPVVERAILNALSEMGPILADLDGRYRRDGARTEEMLRDPFTVEHMLDHSLLYANPEAAVRLGFLIGPDRRARPDVVLPIATGDPHTDLLDALLAMVKALADVDLEVIVVDQTTPEHRVGGLACVKVVVPGTLQMSFGHAQRRLVGLERPMSVPARLGYSAGRLSIGDLNPHPHPFP